MHPVDAGILWFYRFLDHRLVETNTWDVHQIWLDDQLSKVRYD